MSIELPARMAEGEKPENNPPMRLSYCVPRRVMHGGMSLVYLCDAPDGPWDGEEVAVKRLNAEINAIPGAAERFLRECYLWLQLGQHPNVVNALSAHHSSFEAPLLVLEYVPRSLRHMMGTADRDLTRSLRLLIGMIDGLAYIRDVLPGFVHADLKPENILVAADGTAKITDLGLSHVLTVPAVQSAGTASGNATGSVLAGTPLYAAPEQIVSGGAVQASDVYALGCVAYELIAGRPAYGEPAFEADYLLRHLHNRPVPLDSLRGDIPAPLAELVSAMLSKAPEARPDVQHVSATLRSIAEGAGLEVPAPVAQPADISTRLIAAQGMLNLGLESDAIEAVERALAAPDAADKARVWGRCITARAYNAKGDPARANQELDQVAELLTEDADDIHRANYYTERCHAALILGDLTAAAGLAEEAVGILPRYSRMHANAAYVYHASGNLDKAIDALTAALAIAGDFHYFSGLVNYLREANRWDEALAVCDRMIRFHPTVGQGYVLRAVTARLAADRRPMTVSEAAALKRMLMADFAAAQRYEPLDPQVRSLLRSFIDGLPDAPTTTGSPAR